MRFVSNRIFSALGICQPFAVSLILVVTAVVTLSSMNISGQCKRWDVSGSWMMEQTNGFHVTVEISQEGTQISGKAHYDYFKTRNGTLVGTIVANDYYAVISWEDGTKGVYRGKVGADGRIDGTTFDKSNEKTATWYSERAMPCTPPKTTVITPPIIIHTGKVRADPPTNTTSVKNPPAPLKVPWIVASPAVFLPNKNTGFVVLQWDGGDDHSHAKVSVKEGNGDEKFLIEKGKGSQQFPVVRGTTYLYILTDAGVRLATVSVTPR